MKGNVWAGRYKIVRRLGEGRTSTVYLASDIRRRDRSVAIKVLKANSISQRVEDIIRFRAEAHTVSTLTHPNIIKFLQLGEANRLHYLVMEYFPSQSLSEVINNGYETDFHRATEVIGQICTALDYIHQRNIIHRDLKPGNILLSWKNHAIQYNKLKVIDFGLSQVMSVYKPGNGSELVGSFHYLAPEQTGLMSVGVDERSDLYSLGIIFYQLLTRKLPFTGTHIGELIHQHIAKSPRPPSKLNPTIPGILEKIVLKLMAKEPEDRYQSAKGLLNDLEKIRRGGTHFEPGLADRSLKLRYRTKLIGRKRELTRLKVLFDATLKGRGGLCFIKGRPGIGKSRLAEELRDYTNQKAGTFIWGKCFIGLKKVPYGPFKEALDSYLSIFVHYAKAEKEAIRERLIESLGALGEVLVRLNPQIQRIIGAPPPLIPLEPDRENQRFISVAGRFFKTLGELEGGLVLYLDDLQWMDEASFELLSQVTQDIGKCPLLIIGTYRDNEIMPGHPLQKFKEHTLGHYCPLTEITLRPFDGERMARFIARLSYADKEGTASVSRFIQQKSRGNPFFAVEILKLLIKEKAVLCRDSQWGFEPDILSKTEIFASVVDTLLERISLLDEIELTVLSYAAVIGRSFDFNLLFELSAEIREPGPVSQQRIVRIVEKAKDLQLLEEDSGQRGKILFVHERIRETFYRKIGQEKRRMLHNRIGLVLEALYKEKGAELLFDLVYHFVEGENPEKFRHYAFPAGLKAKESFANEEAIKYLSLAKNLLEEYGKKYGQQWIQCAQALGEVFLTIGKYNDTITLYEQILPHVHERIARARLLMHMSQASFKVWDYGNCEGYAKKGLALLDERLPLKRTAVMVNLLKELLVHLSQALFLKWFHPFGRRKEKESEKYRLMVWFYYSLGWSYAFIDTVKFVRTVLRMLNLSASKIGPSKELGMASGAYAIVMISIPLFKRAEIFLKRAIKNNRKSNAPWAVGQSLIFFGYYCQWKGEYKRGIDYFTRSLKIMRRLGDIKESSAIVDNLKNSYGFLGDYKKAIYYNHINHELAQQADDEFGIINARLAYAILYYELGEYERAEEWLAKVKGLTAEERFNFSNFEKNSYLGLIALEKNEIQEALRYLHTAYKIVAGNFIVKQFTISIYTRMAEAYIKQYETEKRYATPSINRAMLRRIKKFCGLAVRKTKKWASNAGRALRVKAKYYSLIGKDRQAEKYFLQSIHQCQSIGRKLELALGYYEYGHFLKKMNREKQAILSWQKAKVLFQEMGAKGWIKKLETLLEFVEVSSSPLQRFIKSFKVKKTRTQLIQLSKELVSSMDVNELLDKVLGGVLELTCAQRGYLLVKDEETDELELLLSKSIDQSPPLFEEFSLGVANEVFRSGRTAIVANAGTDERYAHNQSIIQYGIKSILCFPIVYRKTTKGVCYLDNLLSSSAFTKNNIELLTTITAQALLVYENALLIKSRKKVNIDKEQLDTFCEQCRLTRRERELLLLVLKGFTNKEISKKLYISYSTVHTHLNKIYQKTKAECREGLIQRCIG